MSPTPDNATPEPDLSYEDARAQLLEVVRTLEQGGATLEESIAQFADYIEWRSTHPSDDLMTELLNAQVEEPDGTMRPLERGEVIAYTAMIAGAGGETTARLIGFMGELLGEHPDQRRELAADPALIPSAVEETLRYEPPSPVQGRYVAQDVELYGQTVTWTKGKPQ